MGSDRFLRRNLTNSQPRFFTAALPPSPGGRGGGGSLWHPNSNDCGRFPCGIPSGGTSCTFCAWPRTSCVLQIAHVSKISTRPFDDHHQGSSKEASIFVEGMVEVGKEIAPLELRNCFMTFVFNKHKGTRNGVGWSSLKNTLVAKVQGL